MKFDKNTKILIVGLGLIGGSFCKALKANMFHHIMADDNIKRMIFKVVIENV